MEHGTHIRASEIGEYTYCARAWWLGRVQGVERADDAPLIAGTGRHRRHGRAVNLAVWAWRIGLVLLAMAVVLGIVLLTAK